MNICIFGASSNHPDQGYFQAASHFGRLAAQAGHTLVFGGGADGLMGACARGALNAGGKVLGIAPKLFNEPGFLLSECTELLFTETMAERKSLMFKRSSSFVALPGGIGTLDEFFEAITLKQLGLLRGPLILLNTSGFYDPLYRLLENMAEKGFMSRNCLDLLRLCSAPEEALAAAVRPDGFAGSVRKLEDYTG